MFSEKVIIAVFGKEYKNIKTGVNLDSVCKNVDYPVYAREQWSNIFGEKRGVSVGTLLANLDNDKFAYKTVEAVFIACVEAMKKK